MFHNYVNVVGDDTTILIVMPFNVNFVFDVEICSNIFIGRLVLSAYMYMHCCFASS